MGSVFRIGSLDDDGVVPVYDGHELKVYDEPKYSRITRRFTRDGVRYVYVRFRHPDNPPSNQITYIYLAP